MEGLPAPGNVGTWGHLCPVLPLPLSATALTPQGRGHHCQKTQHSPRAPQKPAEASLVLNTHPGPHENSLRMEPELLWEWSCAFLLLFAFVFFKLEIALLVIPQSCWEAPRISVAIFSVLC